MVGDAIQGDSLMQRTWDGSDWAASETLWSGQKGILGYSLQQTARVKVMWSLPWMKMGIRK